MMDLKNLQQHIRTLAALEETDSPVISGYLNLEDGAGEYRSVLNERAQVLRQSFAGQARADFEEALARLKAFLAHERFREARGVAVFSRGGAQPFFLPLQFRAPLPNWIIADSLPNIYHLVELKDTYHRYVVLISTEESARIVEVNLGAVTQEMWRLRPELRERVGREWTREHYQNHRRERTHRFIKEKVKLLERLMAEGGHTHLILAGNPRMTARARAALPKHLACKLVNTVPAANCDDISDVVAKTLTAFIQQEEQESLAVVDLLLKDVRTGGLAVIGPESSLEAVTRGQADVLVLAKAMPDLKLREKLVRAAERNDCRIEVVNHNDALMESGGVGCLLRFRTAEQYAHLPTF